MGNDDAYPDPERNGPEDVGPAETRCEISLQGMELRVTPDIGALVKNWLVVKQVGRIKELHIKLGTGCWLVLK